MATQPGIIALHPTALIVTHSLCVSLPPVSGSTSAQITLTCMGFMASKIIQEPSSTLAYQPWFPRLPPPGSSCPSPQHLPTSSQGLFADKDLGVQRPCDLSNIESPDPRARLTGTQIILSGLLNFQGEGRGDPCLHFQSAVLCICNSGLNQRGYLTGDWGDGAKDCIQLKESCPSVQEARASIPSTQ